MADTITEVPIAFPTKKGRTKNALKPKNPNIVAEPVIDPEESAGKENAGGLSGNETKKKKKKKQEPLDSDRDRLMEEMMEKMERLRIEKEETEVKLREKEEELMTRGREQARVQAELRKLQKMKEFKPTMPMPIVQSKEQVKKIKRPSAPYILWCKDQWSEAKKANPNAEFKEISNILGAKWKTITAEEKKPYEEKYRIEKEAYLKIIGNEKREHEAMRLLEEEQKQKTAMDLLEQYLQFKEGAAKDDKKKKKEKDPLKPKKPMSAFFVYNGERRPDLLAENKKLLEVSKITSEEWKNMTEEQKRPYEERAKQNKEKYTEEMEAYKHKKEEEASVLKNEEEELMKIHKQEALQLLKKKEKTENIIKKTKETRQKKKLSKNDDPNRPKKPASSFLLLGVE